ncbi:Protein CBG20409 [Caenorhabditis briggsae]|uniref:Protein CBG20409 n=2 Tax=Caenorhabditis briggsae TaxID=6238 RepID=A8XXQ3_CAEBR|nr:Protein CBG20409 [Caenorhabditis briggsae]ULU13698.1 hypothetical protein L3Y34_016287 [Caenorhabditis briggsae]CAP37422.1 Protein CBG20409 [Caenorhabditis briggsae]
MAYQEPPELITFDEQVVECEVEIDTFDEEEEIVGYEEIQTTSHLSYADEDVPGPSGYYNPSHNHHNHRHHYQYEEEEEEEVVVDDMDPNNVYLYDEDTSQLHQIDDSGPFLDDSEDIVSYTTGPSTSSESVLTSSDIPSTSSGPPGPSTPFQAHQRGEFRSGRIQNPQNTYYIRKTHGIGQHHQQQPVYSPVTFQTQYTCEPLPGTAGKRVLKRTHIALSTEEMETIMEDTQVMKRIQSEITHLKKTNGDLKKDYEKAHREFEAMNMEWVEAKTKQKQANEEKRELAKELAQARMTHTQLLKQVALANQPEYQFH